MSEKNRVYKCPNCDADLRYDPEQKKIVCDYCDAVFDAADYDPETRRWDSYGERFGKKIRPPKAGDPGEAAPAEGEEGGKQPEKSGFWKNAHDDDRDLIPMNEFSCTQCGARIYSTDLTIATFCSYCGSSVVLEKRTVLEKKPDFIIPFSVSREEGEQAYRKLLRRAVFAPSYLREDAEVEKFRGIYMPYWMYRLTNTELFGVSGSKSRRSGDYIITKHYRVTTSASVDYDGVCYDASSAFSDNLSQSIAPFDPKKAMPYNPVYLSGFYADAGDVYAGTYQGEACEAVQGDAADALYEKTPVYRENGVDISDLAKRLPLQASNQKGLFPVWFLSIRNKKNDRISYAAVNGQTGKASADLPIDFGKYLLGSFLLSLPLFLILSFLLSFTPKVLLGIAIVLSFIALTIASREINRVYTRQNDYDDAGKMSLRTLSMKQEKELKTAVKSQKNLNTAFFAFALYAVIIGGFFLITIMSRWLGNAFVPVLYGGIAAMIFVPLIIRKLKQNGKIKGRRLSPEKSLVVSAPLSMKKFVYLKLLLGAVLCILVLILNPVQDYWYYAAAAISMALTVWSFRDIIKAYNELTTRPLPQFETRGGDSDAVS